MTGDGTAPRRLTESSGPAGEVLRRALSEQELTAPLPRFTQLQAKRQRRSRRQTFGLFAAAAAIALALGFRALRPSEPLLTVRAEPPVPAPAVSRVPVPAAVPADEGPRLGQTPSKPLVRRDAPSKPSIASAASSSSAVEAAPSPAESVAVAEAAPSGAKSCAELARTGHVEPAMSCYEAVSRGAGVSAELALFEQARLAGKALRQPARALSLLATYRERFPQGSLRAEVMLARIEWSLAAGDAAGARAGVAEALESGLLGERREELLRLRASLAAEDATTESR